MCEYAHVHVEVKGQHVRGGYQLLPCMSGDWTLVARLGSIYYNHPPTHPAISLAHPLLLNRINLFMSTPALSGKCDQTKQRVKKTQLNLRTGWGVVPTVTWFAKRCFPLQSQDREENMVPPGTAKYWPTGAQAVKWHACSGASVVLPRLPLVMRPVWRRLTVSMSICVLHPSRMKCCEQ